MVAVLPVEVVGLKPPQAELAQLTVQVTPAPVLSFVTTAVSVAMALAATVVGGFERVTEIEGWLLLELPPQATSQSPTAAMQQTRVFLRGVNDCLRSSQNDSGEPERPPVVANGSGIPSRCG